MKRCSRSVLPFLFAGLAMACSPERPVLPDSPEQSALHVPQIQVELALPLGAEPAGFLGVERFDLSGLTLARAQHGAVELYGADRYGKPMRRRFDNAVFLARGLPTLARYVKPAQLQGIREWLDARKVPWSPAELQRVEVR
jgi:hypothetical protein